MSDIPLELVETETELTYEGQGDGAGMTLVVKKDDEYLDVHLAGAARSVSPPTVRKRQPMIDILELEDTSPGLHAHWRFDVYEGDVERDIDGNVLNRLVETFEADNLIVTVGKQMIMDRLFGLSAVGAMSRIGVGTSATAAAVGNTTLTGGVFKAYDATPTRTGLVVTAISTFGTADANINWQEAAMDNGTTMLNRIAPIGPFNKTSAVSIVVTITITQA